MAGGGSVHPGVGRLVRRLLPSQVAGGPIRPQPVVVLLGPVGSGKTYALRCISEQCGTGIVHAYYDFDSSGGAATVDVLAQLAFDLSQKWTARPAARFTRFTLGLIATQAPLRGGDRDSDRVELTRLINDFARNRKAEAVAEAVESLIEAAIDLHPDLDVPGSYRDLLKRVMPRLARAVARRPLGPAKRWHKDFPAARAADPVDALLKLNAAARRRPDEVTQWLTEAFLADVRESQQRLSRPDRRSPCRCLDAGRAEHRHNWALLLDNIDQANGSAFIRELLEARSRHLQTHHEDYDPLVVLASSGRWDSTWESRWVAPWKSAPTPANETRMVLPAGRATYANWGGPDTRPISWYFPVLLEQLRAEETAVILGVPANSPLCRFAQRAAGGLPGPTHHLAMCVARELGPGARDVLTEAAGGGGKGWLGVLKTLRLADNLNAVDIDRFIVAAPFATAPWLVPHDAASLISQPEVGSILTELRTAMWVNGPSDGAPTTDYAQLQPWVGRMLITALIRRSGHSHRSYETQFRALLVDSAGDPVREAYCRLAVGEIDRVVGEFVEDFQRVPHQEWVARLRFVTSAPDQLSPERTSSELYDELVTQAGSSVSAGPLAHTVTRLTVASWLAANPFAMPDPALWKVVENSFRDLAPLSRRSDVAALHQAAEDAAARRR